MSKQSCSILMYQTADIGESMFVHVFGAYFGLAVARVLYSQETEENEKEGAVYHSDLFSMIGRLELLWGLGWGGGGGGRGMWPLTPLTGSLSIISRLAKGL